MPGAARAPETAAMVQAAFQGQGVPAGGAIPAPPRGFPGEGGPGFSFEELLQALRSGQISAEQVLELLAMLSGMGGGLPQGPQVPPQGIEEAFLGGGGAPPLGP
jgi:hypothetical protein